MRQFLRRIFCRHRHGLIFERNIYGDEIYHSGGMRSLWRCGDCHGLIAKRELNYKSPELATRDKEQL